MASNQRIITAAKAESTPTTPLTLIRPKSGFVPMDLRELWAYRELLWFLSLRDVKVRYKQTILGIAWAVLQPFVLMVVMNILFKRIGGLPTDGLPGPIFYYSGLLVWNIFQKGLQDSSQSLVANTNLVTKVYFPRIIIPLSSILSALVDFLFQFLVFALLMIYYRIHVTPQILLFPIFVLLAALSAFSVGAFFSALNVKYRDVMYTIPFLTQVWMYATVVMPSSALPQTWRLLYSLNPLVGIVEGARFSLTGRGSFSLETMLPSFLTIAFFFLLSIWYFFRVEGEIADLI